MNTQTVIVTDAGAVRRITLNRPAKANALTAEMMRALAAAVREAHDARLLVLEGNGPKGFCAGGDISEFVQGPEQLKAQEEGLVGLVDACRAAPSPILAAIHGRTLGAGVLLSTLADVVMAADNLSFGLPEIRFNMYPVLIHAVLEEKVTPGVAFQMCAGGRLMDAPEARALGLVTQILPKADFAAGIAEAIAFYVANGEALAIGRRPRALLSTSDIAERMSRIGPLMHENFSRPGVRETIARHLAGLRSAKTA